MKARLVKAGTQQSAQTAKVASQQAGSQSTLRQAVKAKLAARGGQQQASYAAWRALWANGGVR